MMLASVGSELDGRAATPALIGEEGGRVEDVYVVVRPDYTEICIPDPEAVVSDGFEDHCWVAGLVATNKLASPRRRAILSLPVHTLDAS